MEKQLSKNGIIARWLLVLSMIMFIFGILAWYHTSQIKDMLIDQIYEAYNSLEKENNVYYEEYGKNMSEYDSMIFEFQYVNPNTGGEQTAYFQKIEPLKERGFKDSVIEKIEKKNKESFKKYLGCYYKNSEQIQIVLFLSAILIFLIAIYFLVKAKHWEEYIRFMKPTVLCLAIGALLFWIATLDDVNGFYKFLFVLVGIGISMFGIYITFSLFYEAILKVKDPKAYEKLLQERELKKRTDEAVSQILIEMEKNEAIKSQTSDVPWEKRYYTDPCPYCGHYKVRAAVWDDKALSVSFWGVASSKIGTRFKCEQCKNMW